MGHLPDTIDRRMTTGDGLILACRKADCRARHVATKAQAERRFGPDATAYEIEQVARCPVCGSKEIEVAIAGAHQLAAVPERDLITAGDVKRLGLGLGAHCAPCRHGLEPRLGPRQLTIPMAKVFERQLVRCHVCGLPVCGLSVVKPAAVGGGGRDTVYEYWEAGSPADPVVRAFWGKVGAALKERQTS